LISGHKSVLTATALRDFFIARDASEIAEAYHSLVKTIQAPAPTPGDWEEVEFAFNRLFVGPKALPAPPFASIYMDSEPQIMGDTTIRVRQIYQVVGLDSPWQGSLPDDHLSLELDASIHMKTSLANTDSEELKALWRYFLIDHLCVWIPRFVNRVRSAKEVPQAILFAVDQLAAWLNEEKSAAAMVEQVNI